MKIVCVDDHPILLKGLIHKIRQILPDANIHGFPRAEDALVYMQENICEVLISEIELCGTDGLRLADSAKRLYPDLSIIFLTVCDEKEHAHELLRINPSGYLVKPARKEQLEFELKNLKLCTC